MKIPSGYAAALASAVSALLKLFLNEYEIFVKPAACTPQRASVPDDGMRTIRDHVAITWRRDPE